MIGRQAALIGSASVIDEEALAEAMRFGTIAATGFDAAEEGPVAADHSMSRFESIVLSHHWVARSCFAEHQRHTSLAQELTAVPAGLRLRAVWNRKALQGPGRR
jgi:D-3-phosphoglycerate dehydrogenase